jgi:N-acetylneuraminic acid mutarotase
MKKILSIFFLSVLGCTINAQTAQSAWIAGSTFTNQITIPGTKGVPSTTNIIGARQHVSIWNGNLNTFYVFGGSTNVNYNDLWRYDINLDEWVWLSGSTASNQPGVYGTLAVGSTTNSPGSRNGSASWTDLNGDLWLFGGFGYGQSTISGTGDLQDLWKYTVADNKWMWVSGAKNVSTPGNYGTQGVAAPTNTPGPRHNPVTWVDNSGNLWMFGGYGLTNSSSPGYLNDLWKFDVTTLTWTWVSGNSTTMVNGTYGTKGVSSSINKPGGRQSSVAWKDNSNNLWVFGGFGRPSTSVNTELNDLWKFDMNTLQWTWITGSNVGGTSSSYGIKGAPSTTNTPGARKSSSGWEDGNKFWLFGGSYGTNYNNELWMYDVNSNKWTWVDGSSSINQNGVYGTKNLFASNNIIGSRHRASATKDINGKFILFGGYGYASADFGYLNDVWRINPCYTDYAVNLTSTLSLSICPNSNTTLSANGNGVLGWYSAASGGTYLGSGGTYLTPTLTTNTTYYVQDSTCGAGPRTAITVTINSAPNIVITGTNLACANKTVALNTGGAVSYTWSTSQNGNSIIVSPSVTTTYTVIATGVNSCTNSAVKTITVNPLPTLTVTGNNVLCAGSTTTLTVSGANSYTWSAGFFVPTIGVAPLTSTTYSVMGKDVNNCTNTTTYFVSVNALPTLTLSGNAELCSGNSTILSASGADTYTWSNSSTSNSISVAPTSNTTYTLTGQDLTTGCLGNAVKTLTVLAKPTLNVITPSAQCAGNNYTLNVSGADTYTWLPGNLSGASVVVTPSISMTYTALGTAANTCTNSTSVFVTVNSNPNITIVGALTPICAGNSITLFGSGGLSNGFTWSNGATTFSTIVTPSVTATYTVIGTAGNTCTNSAVTTVTVNPLPILNVTTTNTLLCSGQTASLSVTGASTYTWSDNSNGVTISVAPTSNTTYTVTGVDVNNCSNSSVFTQSVSTCTGIYENTLEFLFRVFPNPNNGDFTIQSPREDVVTIFNEIGQVITTIELNQQNNFSCKVNSLQSGIYFVIGKTIKQKVIVTK